MTNLFRILLFTLSASIALAQAAPGVGAPGVSASSVAGGGGGGGSGTVTEVTGATSQTAVVSVATGATTPVITVDVLPQSPTGNSIISSGGVDYPGTGLAFTVGAARYVIQGVEYTSPITTLTASAADPTNPRIDIVALNTSGLPVIITGTPAASPVAPDVDPTTQVQLTFYLLAANATAIPVTTTNIYLENTEWTMSKTGAPINLSSASNPYAGSVDIEATSAVAGNLFTATKPAAGTFDPGEFNTLFFYIRNKAAWANSKSISIQLLRSGEVRGSVVTFKGGTYGFDSATNFTSYQQIAIPTTAFGANGITCDAIRFTVSGGGAAFGWYIDNITLQTGISSAETSTKMQWQGNYSATKAYNLNDVVLSSEIQYVAIQPGVGHTPASSATYWQPSSGSGFANNVASGGTGVTSATAYAPLFGGTTSTNPLQSGTAGTAGQLLRSSGAGVLPTWTTATFPATAGSSGNVLVSDGTNWSSSSVISNIGAQTIWVPAAGIASTATNGSDYINYVATLSGRPDIAFTAFDPTIEQHAQFSVAMPKSWNNGTVTAQFFWSHPATTVNFGVVWRIMGVALSDDDPIGTVFGTGIAVADTGGTTDDLYISAFTSAVTIAGTPATGDLVIFDVYRDVLAAGDTMAVSARLIGVKLIYTTTSANDN